MSNYVRGLKRQQIIERWLRGYDDPEFEVFPTKKEGRYVVKKRIEPLESKKELEEGSDEEVSEGCDEAVEEPTSKLVSIPAPKPRASRAAPKRIPQTTHPDTTVNIEILEQLKLLGEEMKQQRKKKEQKEVIKHAVQKQFNKNPRSKVIKEETESEDED